MPALAALDADVISNERPRADMALLKGQHMLSLVTALYQGSAHRQIKLGKHPVNFVLIAQ